MENGRICACCRQTPVRTAPLCPKCSEFVENQREANIRLPQPVFAELLRSCADAAEANQLVTRLVGAHLWEKRYSIDARERGDRRSSVRQARQLGPPEGERRQLLEKRAQFRRKRVPAPSDGD